MEAVYRKEGRKEGEGRDSHLLTRQRRRRALPVPRLEPRRDPRFPPQRLRRVRNELIQQPIIVVALAHERLHLNLQHVSQVSINHAVQSDYHEARRGKEGEKEE